MRTGLLALVLIGKLAHAEHGGISSPFSDDGGKTSPAFDGAPLLLPGTAASRKAAADALPALKAEKPVPKKVGAKIDGPVPVVFLAVGVDDLDGRRAVSTTERAKALRRAVSVSNTGARIVEIAPLTLQNVAEAWAKVRRRERFVETPSSALVILDTTFAEPANALGVEPLLGTSLGPVRWGDFGEAVRRLEKSIYPANLDVHPRMQTAVLGSFVGQVDCDALPGPLWGASANRSELELNTFEKWITTTKTRREFPLAAVDWYNGWRETAVGLEVPRAGQGFYCANDARGETYGAKVVVRPWLQPSRSLASRPR